MASGAPAAAWLLTAAAVAVLAPSHGQQYTALHTPPSAVRPAPRSAPHPSFPAPRSSLSGARFLRLPPSLVHTKNGSHVLSNVALPRDTRGEQLLTGETDVLRHGSHYYLYTNVWGSCPPVDCCTSASGCASCCYVPPTVRYPDACVFAGNHTVVV